MDVQVKIPKINIDVARELNYQFVDVRSPQEFAEFHIPGAINIPVFTNDERVQVGTLYKQKGKSFAIECGLKIFSKKLKTFYQQLKSIHDINPTNPIIIYCWRGGLRSKTVVSLLGSLGLPLIQLEGGIRSYRYKIIDFLNRENLLQDKTFIVIEGFTGTRKTDILECLVEDNYPVLNLEKMANHRGSVFGDIGRTPNSQKQFEALLYEKLSKMKHTNYLIIEAESKRIGRVVLPDCILKGKLRGIRIHIDTPLSQRVETIKNMYDIKNHHDKIVEGFMVLKKRLPHQIFTTIMEAIERKNYDDAISQILIHYYDPKYEHAIKLYETDVHFIFYNHLNEGIKKVKEVINMLNLKINHHA